MRDSLVILRTKNRGKLNSWPKKLTVSKYEFEFPFLTPTVAKSVLLYQTIRFIRYLYQISEIYQMKTEVRCC